MPRYPTILSIAGTGRNVGKTLLACKIINAFRKELDIVALKITPHRHKDTGNAKLVLQENDIILMEELNPSSQKDTGRMLNAGAVKAFLLQTNNQDLAEELRMLFTFLDKESIIVCETGKLMAPDQAGISLFVKSDADNTNSDIEIPENAVHRIVNFNGAEFDFDTNSITVRNNQWILTK